MYQSIFRPGLFAGQTIIVTGGGSGIGRCTAHELAALGARVLLVGRTPEKLASVVAEIAESGGAAQAYPCNIRDEEAVTAMVTQMVAEHGRLHGLVNNAGGQFSAQLKDISKKGWEAVVQTNLTGGFLMARECLKHSMEKHGGAIVNIVADMWGSMPGMGHSGAARAGMVSFTETAAFEWAAFGVRVNAVAPGYVASSGLDTYPPQVKQMILQAGKQVPLQRMATESEISGGIVFLLSEAASFITGSVLRIDGGRPQVRGGYPMHVHNPVAPFDGFHLASQPKVLEE
jgi:citronellol/citronellal dehydrogenase